MTKRIIILAMLFGLFISSQALYAQSDKSEAQVSEATLRNFTEDDQNRRLTEISRAISNLQRQMDRLEERFQSLDHDLKELKRKVPR